MSYPNYPGSSGYPTGFVQIQQTYPYPNQAYPSYPPSINQGSGYPATSYPFSQQPTYPASQQPTYPVSQQPTYPVAQQPTYQGYPTTQVYPAQQQSSYPQQYPSGVSLEAAAPPPQVYPAPSAPGYGPPHPVATPNPPQPLNPAYPSAVSAAPYHHQMTTVTPAQQYVPSVHPHQPFDARADADALHKAMKGLGTNEKALVNVLCRRTCLQRVQITQAYKSGYGKDLESKIKSETSGTFGKVLVALILSRPEFLAREMRSAVDGLGTKEGTLIEILCSGTNQEIREINEAYVRMYGRPLEKDIGSDTSGTFKMLLVSLAQGQRDEGQTVDYQKVKDDAHRLYQAGAAKLGTDESTFNSILATRSWAHLRQLMAEYQSMTGRSLEQAVASEFSANAEKGLLGILQCAQNRPAYFAKRLHSSMKGAGTRDGTLIRIVVSRCDVDLGSIKLEYQKLFGRSLLADVSGDTSGDYKHALVTLIG